MEIAALDLFLICIALDIFLKPQENCVSEITELYLTVPVKTNSSEGTLNDFSSVTKNKFFSRAGTQFRKELHSSLYHYPILKKSISRLLWTFSHSISVIKEVLIRLIKGITQLSKHCNVSFTKHQCISYIILLHK